MQFVFNGTLENLKENIRKRAAAFHKDIVIYQYEPTVLQIGFLRLGHSGGRFFIANITEESDSVILDGEIKNLNTNMPSTDTRSLFQKVRDMVFGFVALYVFLALIPWLIWSIFNVPHPWIAFAIPAAIIVAFELLYLFNKLLRKGERSFDKEDDSFLRFMSMISSGEVTVPSNSQELYKMLINTEGLHSLPKIKNDVITWELYDNIFVEASISEYDTIIDILRKNVLHGSYMHWHPDVEEMYEELYNIGKKGNILVLRKLFTGTEIYYLGAPDKYRFDKNKKWQWGKLIYLEQKPAE